LLLVVALLLVWRIDDALVICTLCEDLLVFWLLVVVEEEGMVIKFVVDISSFISCVVVILDIINSIGCKRGGKVNVASWGMFNSSSSDIINYDIFIAMWIYIVNSDIAGKIRQDSNGVY